MKHNRLLPAWCALAAPALLIAAFPKFNLTWCAWIALVPWLLALRGRSALAWFWWSYLIGVLFFIGSIWWLIHVTLPGWLLLCAYLGLYFGLFGLIVRRLTASKLPPLLVHPMMAAGWVALEYIRSHLLSGFGWNLLAYTQTSRVPLIQMAELTGAWGVSFMIVWVNAAIAEFVIAGRKNRGAAASLAAAVGCVIAAGAYGLWRLPQIPDAPTVRIAVVQGSIPQDEKWEGENRGKILDRYEALTRTALETKPQLIIWPETSTPGYFGLDEEITQRVTKLIRSVKVPMLVGAPIGVLHGVAWHSFNSAVLLAPSGEMVQRYDKLHLVPFGEMIPMEDRWPWLRDLMPAIGQFLPGTEPTVFRAMPLPPFSVLICFEDVFPDLARQFVREGARLLVVITNDAWFGPSAAAYQHAQTSAFRAVELRVPVVRAANTGWSGCIDAAGRVVGRVADAQGTELFVPGTRTCEMAVSQSESVYLKFGDWLPILCVLLTAGWALQRFLNLRSRN